jgi:uncharacterized membrane protein
VSHPVALVVLVVAFAVVIAVLSDARTYRQFWTRVVVASVFLFCLMGLGAVFGKTLGDFLRGVNG